MTDSSPFESLIADLSGLLLRRPTPEEERAWLVMSPALRARAATRLDLMRRWVGERGELTADEAADIAGVKIKRFYQMASAWKKEPGLAAVGAYATAKSERGARLDPRVNAALQANVARIVKVSPGASMEARRRLLEAAAAAALPKPKDEQDAKKLRIPSLNVVRAVIERELHRLNEKKLLGAAIAMDCCATTMRRSDGSPHILFALIDRGTRRILGHALGTVDASVEAYARAASDALAGAEAEAAAILSWALRTASITVVVGEDGDAWDDLKERYAAARGLPELSISDSDRRYGGQFRKFVGDRIGRVVLRPGWLAATARADEPEIFSDDDAATRVAVEVATYNESATLASEGEAAHAPPENLLAALRFLARAEQ